MSHTPPELIGRANTVLVEGTGDTAVPVLSAIVATATPHEGGPRVVFTGSARFMAKAATHVRHVILPMVDRIVTALGLPVQRYDIAIRNLGAASKQDLSITVTGFSADLAVLAAMLSATLGIPVPGDTLCTGHLASPAGDIAMVKSLAAKLQLAVTDEKIRRFVYPCLKNDGSLMALSPQDCQRMEDALVDAKATLSVVPVKDVAEFVKAVFPDSGVPLGALRRGYFYATVQGAGRGDSVEAAVLHFATENPSRFWNTLREELLAGRPEPVRRLLDAWCRFHAADHRYPSGCGAHLAHVLASVPPSIRRLRLRFPLCTQCDALALTQVAQDVDLDDVGLFLAAIRGRSPGTQEGCPADDERHPVKEADARTLGTILNELSRETLADRIALPVDSARAAYATPVVLAPEYDDYLESITAFFVHLASATGRLSGSLETGQIQGEAIDLVERAFARQGGGAAARAEARDGLRGGLRFVFDAMADQYKRDATEKHIRRVLTEAFNVFDWGSKKTLTQALLQQLGPTLPPELARQPAERFAHRVDVLIRVYVDALETVNSVLRTL